MYVENNFIDKNVYQIKIGHRELQNKAGRGIHRNMSCALEVGRGFLVRIQKSETTKKPKIVFHQR